ncbi:conserved Plasmodium protein, unknown function [Plasmodium ovale wallikeri]|uniref:Uncharacterized protein n=1 Tax=Plasmodium ovale wallikeri TaxID=864142 RepID=A0A1A8Z4K2_PLAOA|nr:conserved Plasmodium protein, unknown function [Plasmodium ovale wallikeri]
MEEEILLQEERRLMQQKIEEEKKQVEEEKIEIEKKKKLLMKKKIEEENLLEEERKKLQQRTDEERKKMEKEKTQIEKEKTQIEKEKTQIEKEKTQIEKEKTQIEKEKTQIEKKEKYIEEKKTLEEKLLQQERLDFEEGKKRERQQNIGELKQIEHEREELARMKTSLKRDMPIRARKKNGEQLHQEQPQGVDGILAEENVGEENVGEENIGDENVGDENIGDENIGEENIGEENIGDDNIGDDNIGDDNIGDENVRGENSRDNHVGKSKFDSQLERKLNDEVVEKEETLTNFRKAQGERNNSGEKNGKPEYAKEKSEEEHKGGGQNKITAMGQPDDTNGIDAHRTVLPGEKTKGSLTQTHDMHNISVDENVQKMLDDAIKRSYTQQNLLRGYSDKISKLGLFKIDTNKNSYIKMEKHNSLIP